MNARKALYFAYLRGRGSSIPDLYERYRREDAAGVSPDVTRGLLVQMLAHCERAVPYCAQVMRGLGSFREDPEAYLAQLPILTKDIIRERLEELQAVDLAQRKWHYNTSGGSTGEPARFVQDAEYADRAYALTLLFSWWAGKEVGEPEVRIWGSERDIIQGSMGWRAWLANSIANTTYFNAYRMTSDSIHALVHRLSTRPPRLTVAYSTVMYDLARYVAQEGITVAALPAVITSAETLYPFMREQIEAVFHCRVFDRYGSREVGDVASQCPVRGGLHVAPWGNYIEIVDDAGRRLPDGVEGDILITSLNNYAMPLIRYRIGDRGALATRPCPCGRQGQLLEGVIGRSSNTFRRRDGALVSAGYFMGLLYFRDWVKQYQVVQKGYSHIVFRIVPADPHVHPPAPQPELDEISAHVRLLMGDDCTVTFDFVDEIPPTPSGKFLYTLSEVKA